MQYLRTPLFRDIPPPPPLPLKRTDIEKDYDDTLLLPQTPPNIQVLKTDFDRPITNLIDKANNIIEMVSKNQKQDLDNNDIHYDIQNNSQSSFQR